MRGHETQPAQARHNRGDNVLRIGGMGVSVFSYRRKERPAWNGLLTAPRRMPPSWWQWLEQGSFLCQYCGRLYESFVADWVIECNCLVKQLRGHHVGGAIWHLTNN